MKFSYIFVLFWMGTMSPVAAAHPSIVVTLDWINHAEMQCKGCTSQDITLESGSGAIIGQECGDRVVYLRIRPRWKGDAIEISLTSQNRTEDGKFADGKSRVVVLQGRERAELTIEGLVYRIGAKREKTEPNKAPEPTRTSVTPRADARVAPAARVAHL
jgi:hypothetical protein